MTARVTKKRQHILVGSKIRDLRKTHSLTQSALATRIGVQQSDLCRMETGEYRVSLDTLFRILTVFEMNIGDFFMDESPAVISREEKELLELYRELGDTRRTEILDFLRSRSKRSGGE